MQCSPLKFHCVNNSVNIYILFSTSEFIKFQNNQFFITLYRIYKSSSCFPNYS